MRARQRELEMLLLTAFAAVPLYFTGAVGPVPLGIFHAAFAAMIVRVARGGSPELVPEWVLRAIAIACVPLYVVDAVANHAIAASTHLVLFIAVYQPIETMRRDNRAQRLLIAALIFVASVATATDITIVLFVVTFTFLMLRQLILLSHLATAASVGREYEESPSRRAAAFYLAATTVLASIMFPLIPRVRNPLVHGMAGALTNATTGLSTSIDFNQDRTSTPDPTVVARVWMGQEAVPFFTPLRLRGTVYDRYSNNSWEQSRTGFRPIAYDDGTYQIARPRGFTRPARVQQRLVSQNRLFLPTGTYSVAGLPAIAEGPTRDAYVTQPGRDVLTYDVRMAMNIEPFGRREPRVIPYPLSPAVVAFAQRIAGAQQTPHDRARAIERYLSTNFKYLQRPEEIGHPMTVDEFLLKERRGHCEYFAAGMVVLMSALGTPARIIGGFYGGRLNPLTGYFVLRREDAHAWVEVWDGSKWETFDPTPASLRPGNGQDGLLRTYATALSDSVNYFWDRYVLTFGLTDQIALLTEAITRLRGGVATGRGVAAAIRREVTWRHLADGAAIAIALVALFVLGRRRREPLFAALERHLALLGIDVGPSMTMEEALDRLRAEQPDAARALQPLIRMYEEERFSPRPDRRRIVAIRRGLASVSTKG